MSFRARRMLGVICLLAGIVVAIFQYYQASETGLQGYEKPTQTETKDNNTSNARLALDLLSTIPVKGRAAKTNYSRTQFGDGWLREGSCDMRNVILNRDLAEAIVNDLCKVTKGTLIDPYTGTRIEFLRGNTTSDLVQIDHVVALSNAWQTGAQQLTADERIKFANDPLELLAVDGKANQQKADGDAATWLPSNKSFRCQYVARQIAVKAKYRLWVTEPERNAMQRVLAQCPGQLAPNS